jgi:hypothetical protein
MKDVNMTQRQSITWTDQEEDDCEWIVEHAGELMRAQGIAPYINTTGELRVNRSGVVKFALRWLATQNPVDFDKALESWNLVVKITDGE